MSNRSPAEIQQLASERPVDPDVLLAELRDLTADLLSHWNSTEIELIFDALDEHLSTGGALPHDWRRR
jgi:NTP pyrophosphatase (non-canonical NTP hydrolase)